MRTTIPPILSKGDTIGIISPSLQTYGESKKINEAVSWLKKNGFKIKFSENINSKNFGSAGTRYQRANDINSFFADSEVKAIFCTIGGDTANQTLDLLNYKMIASNPKPIIGYSDNTNLLLGIYSQTGLETYHGPNLIQIPTITKTSQQQLIQILSGNYNQKICDFEIIKPGIAKGKLLGGNLFIINNLKSTVYSPNYNGAILFWEDINEGLGSLEYQLYQLHLSGILGKISGMVIGHIVQTKQGDIRPYKDIIMELTKQYNYPIIKTNCFGHSVKRFFTFPIGRNSIIDTNCQLFQLI